MLTRSFPPETVDEVVAAQGRTEQRSRLLPARLVVYYVMALALFASEGYEEVMRQLVAGLAWTTRWRGTWRVPSSPAISKARTRLGPAVLAALFDRVCVPVAAPDTAGAFYRSWRLVAVDGTTFDAPDEAVNTARFGKPSNDQGTGAFPQVRVVALAECGTHAVFAAALAGITTGEQELFRRLLGKIGPGMLVLADRNFLGHQLWAAAAATGADLLWRAKSDTRLPVVTELADGSYLSYLAAPGTRGRGQRITVRVIEYTLQASESAYPHKAGEVYRLVTTILDPDLAPAEDLAAAYAQRWEIESVLDEIKTHQLAVPTGAALPRPGRGRAGDLGDPAGPPRDPRPHPRQRPRRGPGPRPGLVHPRAARRPPPGHRPGGAFPPPDYAAPPDKRSLSCSNGSTSAAAGTTPASYAAPTAPRSPPRNPSTGTSSNRHQI